MYQLLLIFIILLYVLILIPAALGTSYGIREKYAQLLIQIFKVFFQFIDSLKFLFSHLHKLIYYSNILSSPYAVLNNS